MGLRAVVRAGGGQQVLGATLAAGRGEEGSGCGESLITCFHWKASFGGGSCGNSRLFPVGQPAKPAPRVRRAAGTGLGGVTWVVLRCCLLGAG